MADYIVPESESDSDDETPSNIVTKATEIYQQLLPKKSKELYTKAYDDFQAWKNTRKIKTLSEDVMMVYFNYLLKDTKLKSSTVWSRWSMLKSTMRIHDDFDLNNFKKLKSYLKQNNEGYKPKKSKILFSNDISKFCNEAEDKVHLARKVILIVGVFGACRRSEIHDLTMDNIEDNGRELIFSVPETKNDVARSFIIANKQLYDLCKKYIALRPVDNKRGKKVAPNFFINYRNGKCTAQPIGVNTIGLVPTEVATFLNLPEPKSYTGHSFRRSGATLLADSGADIATIMRFGGWKSQTVSSGYVEDSRGNKRKVSENMCRELTLDASALKLRKKVQFNTPLVNSESRLNEPSTSTGIKDYEEISTAELIADSSETEDQHSPKMNGGMSENSNDLPLRSSVLNNSFAIGRKVSLPSMPKFPNQNVSLKLSKCSNVTVQIFKMANDANKENFGSSMEGDEEEDLFQ